MIKRGEQVLLLMSLTNALNRVSITRWVGRQALESSGLGLNPGSSAYRWMTQSELLNLSVLQFSHRKMGIIIIFLVRLHNFI